MAVYLLNVGLIALWAFAFLGPQKKLAMAKPEKYFSVIAAIQWVLISGLRHISVGADTEAYKTTSFDLVKLYSWEKLWDNFKRGVFLGEEIKDPGYPLIQKFFQMFFENYQMWLVCIAVIFTIPMAVWIYKKSKNPFMSFLIYSCFFYEFFAITGHRQTIATGFVVFLGDFLIKKRKFIPFLLMTLLMSTIHKSCLVFLPFYFIYNKKVTLLYSTFMIFLAIIAFVFRENVTLFLADASGYDNYGIVSGAGAYTFTLLMIMITVLSLWRKKYILEQNPESVSFFNALMLSVVFIPMTFVDPNAMRIVQYFSVYIMLMIPEIINSFEKRDRAIAYVVSVSVLVLLFINKNPQYMFFWE